MPRLSPEELATRSQGMGSTDVVEVAGLSPWRGAGPMRLYCEKLGIVSPDDEEEIEDDGWLEWGHIMEPIIAGWYEHERGCKLMPAGQVVSREHPWLWATLDAVVLGQSRIVEVKNIGSPKLYAHWSESDPDGIPLYVRAQVTIGMYCHGARECDVVASVGGRPPQAWSVGYDAELAGMLVSKAAAFWQLVQTKTPPPLDATPATKAYLLDRYPRNVEPVMLDADPETDELGHLRAEESKSEKRHKANKDRLDAELLARVGTADGIQGTGWMMTWKVDSAGKRRQRFTKQTVRA